MMIGDLDHLDETPDGVERNISVVLACIHDYYKKALDRLPAQLIPSLLDAGFCFGFLDPVANIIANTVFQFRDGESKKRKRKRSRAFATTNNKGRIESLQQRRQRDAAFSSIIAESSSSKHSILRPPLLNGSAVPNGNGSVASRSLRGLATFLTSYCRYLTVRDALRYLRLSKADLLVAVRLVELDHALTHSFTINDPTAQVALRCAAISAVHPMVATFLSRSFSLASHLDEVSNILPEKGRVIGRSTIKRLFELSSNCKPELVDPLKPMQHAISRMQPYRRTEPVPAGLEDSLMRVLLDKIHVLYLEAISCMPKHDICSRHHRGLLKAGHCYGPFDPVTNIILNTIWYDTAFPTKQEFDVKLICTKSLARIECFSLDGLVAFTCSVFPEFSEYKAMEYLLVNNARIDRVTMKAIRKGHAHSSESDTYDTAARAANHPCPTALVQFATTGMQQVGKTLRKKLKCKPMLSPSDVCTISEMLSQNFLPGESAKLPQTHVLEIISARCEEFEDRQSVIFGRVEAALHMYAQQERQDYELQVICDLNDDIPDDGRYDYMLHHTRFSHINIWAKRKGSQYADEVPTLFFIECSNTNEEKDMQGMRFLCHPILEPSKYAGRCFHCEQEGFRIIHPPSEKGYLGRCTEFEDMASGKNPVSNEHLVDYGNYQTFFADGSETNDSIYFDPILGNEDAITRDQEWKEKRDPRRKDLSWLEDQLRQDLALARKKYRVSLVY